MIFLDGFPESLKIGGVEYPIHTDFRVILAYDRILNSGEDDGMSILQALQNIFDVIPRDIEEAITALNWFINCGKNEKTHKPSNKVLGINSNIPFDFEEDDLLIWSAFKARYGIDLLKIESLHWWLFRALLDDLGEEVRLSQIMQYRVIDTNMDGISKERKKFLDSMQRYYKISKYEEERDEEFIQALINGDDISKFLEKQEEAEC